MTKKTATAAPKADPQNDYDVQERVCSRTSACISFTTENIGICLRDLRYRRNPQWKSKAARLADADWPIVESAALFSGVEDGIRHRLIDEAKIKPLFCDEILFQQDETDGNMHFVLEGWIKTYRTSVDGTVILCDLAQQGEIIGDFPAFPQDHHFFTAEAIIDSRVVEIPLRHFQECFAESPVLARNVAHIQSQRLQHQREELGRAYWASAPQRLAAFLAALFEPSARRVETRLPYDKNVLAARLGMTPESLSRAFQVLRDAGVRTHMRCIAIDDIPQLRRYAALDDGAV